MEKDKKWVANVFVVNEEQLSKAVNLTLSEIAKVDSDTALEWCKDYIENNGCE